MKIVGIDLSGPRNFADTCLVIFEERGDEIHFVNIYEGADDVQILEAISGLGRDEQIVVGIDAPLSYNPVGGDRKSDSELRRLVHAQGGGAGIMPPTMIRMVYLTLRGLQLTRILESMQQDLRIVEVHPGACMILRGADQSDVRNFKRDFLARGRLLAWLQGQGVRGITRPETATDHYIAACAAALGAWQWSLGKSAWCFAAEPPHHPYDFAC